MGKLTEIIVDFRKDMENYLTIKYAILFFVGGSLLLLIILSVMALIFRSYISLDGDSFHWIMSSIFQGLFPILAFAGVLIVSRIELTDRWIDKWDGDIRDRLGIVYEHDCIKWGKYYTLLEHLEHRRFKDFLKVLPNDDATENLLCNNSVRNCKHKIKVMENSIAHREEIWNWFKYPLFHGGFVIVLSITLLLAPTIIIEWFPFTIYNWNSIAMVWMVILTAVVILEIVWTILITMYQKS